MEDEVADSERLAIFVYDASKIKTDGVHWRAFLPARDGERSLYRTDELSDAEVAAIGSGEAADNRENQALHGWGVTYARVVRLNPPLVVQSAEPPPRHGVIIGWPAESQDRHKLAMVLAENAGTVRWPPNAVPQT